MLIPRPVRLLLALAALLLVALPATAGAASYPTIKSISPKKLGIGDKLTITGKNFRSGKRKNTIVFKRDGKRAIFVRVPNGAKTRLRVVVPTKLLPFLARRKGKPTYTRFRIRVLSARFGKRFTTTKASPQIGPVPTGGTATKDDCDGDRIANSKDTDDDNDLLSDELETSIRTDPCKRDTDGDGMSDGWEYQSSLDRNGKALPAPATRPYPNALDPKDGTTDSDGDGLTNAEEYVAWAMYGHNAFPLSYSGGNPASAGRGPVPAQLAYMDRDGNGFLSDLERDADGDGIPNMDEGDLTAQSRLVADKSGEDPRFYDFGVFSTGYIAAVAKLTADAGDPSKFICNGINQVPFYCTSGVDTQKVDALDWVASDSDGDGIRDDADDVDHDDVPNFTEYLSELTLAPADRHYGQINPCFPNTDARLCLIGTEDVDKDGIANRDDTDDDGDGLSDVVERTYGTDPLRSDTDGDGVDDGFEYQSAIDLNSAAVPYPGKRPYPNPLDRTDADLDFDQDSLTLREEYKAWVYSGKPATYNYSDGTKYTGGRTAIPTDPAHAYQNLDGNPYLSDDEKDVDNDGLTNFDETHGGMRAQWWIDAFGADPFKESPYPGPAYLETSFVDADTDGDGVKDGADDQDHDGFSNAVEVHRAADWHTTYVSTTHNGSNPYARVQPFNPCKPIYSDACHAHPPFNYYSDGEDWESPVHTS
jgi:hypothetical protein